MHRLVGIKNNRPHSVVKGVAAKSNGEISICREVGTGCRKPLPIDQPAILGCSNTLTWQGILQCPRNIIAPTNKGNSEEEQARPRYKNNMCHLP